MHWMIMPLRRYADFEGRSRRLEYWMFWLFVYLVTGLFLAPLFLLDFGWETRGASPLVVGLIVLVAISYLAIVIPSIAVSVRRLHDRDMSGWFYLLSFIPYVGALILLVLMLLPGTPGPNRFGPDPLDPHGDTDLDEVFR